MQYRAICISWCGINLFSERKRNCQWRQRGQIIQLNLGYWRVETPKVYVSHACLQLLTQWISIAKQQHTCSARIKFMAKIQSHFRQLRKWHNGSIFRCQELNNHLWVIGHQDQRTMWLVKRAVGKFQTVHTMRGADKTLTGNLHIPAEYRW